MRIMRRNRELPFPRPGLPAERAVPARARELHPIRDEPEELEPDENSASFGEA